jgi:hypothetical protein
MTGRIADETTRSRSERPDERPDETRTRQGLQFVRSGGGFKNPTPDETPAGPFDPETMVRCADYHAHQTSHHRDGSGWTCDACSEVAP